MEEQLKKIKNLLYTFIDSQNKINEYNTADIEGCKNVDIGQQEEIYKNELSISDNSDAILETYENNIEMEESISNLENAILEVYELLIESEE